MTTPTKGLTPEALRMAIERLGLTQIATAELIGVKPNSLRRWLSGSREVPMPAAILIRLLVNARVSHSDVEKARDLRSDHVKIPE